VLKYKTPPCLAVFKDKVTQEIDIVEVPV
jgi:hypothetical protein